MPRVPILDGPRVNPQGLPGARQQASLPSPINVGAIAAQQNMQMGESIMQAGGALGKVVLAAQNEANELRVTEAQEEALKIAQYYTFDPENGYTNIRGSQALSRQSGKPLAVEYTDKLAEDYRRISDGLGNDAQRQMFAKITTQMLGRFQGQVMQHENDEYNAYKGSVLAGKIENRIADTALNFNNPSAIRDNVNQIKSAVYHLGVAKGWSAEQIESEQRKQTSKAHNAVVLSALQKNDTAYAANYFNQNMQEMEPADILRSGGLVQDEVSFSLGNFIADKALAGQAANLMPSDLDRAWAITMSTESSGQHFEKDGSVKTSSAGAIGIAQVMPETGPEAAKLAGLEWDKEKFKDDPEYNSALGRAYFENAIKANNGDILKAWAAYNAGQGRLNQALKKAADNDAANWLQYMPAETRGYVEKNAKAYGAGMGVNRPTLAQLQAELINNPALVDNPKAQKAALARLKAQYTAIESTRKQQEEQALDTAYKTLYENQGNMNALPANLLASIPGDKLNSLLAFADKAAKGNAHNPEVWAGILTLPKEQLAVMTPSEFYKEFRPYLDDQHLEKGYALIADAKGQASDQHLETITTTQRIKLGGIEAGIIPADDKPDETQLKNFARFQYAIDDRVRQFERLDLKSERKANSEELQKIIDSVVMDTVSIDRSLWFDKDDVPITSVADDDLKDAYVNVGNEKIRIAQIPDSARSEIIIEMRKRGMPVTEQAIASWWVRAGKPKE